MVDRMCLWRLLLIGLVPVLIRLGRIGPPLFRRHTNGLKLEPQTVRDGSRSRRIHCTPWVAAETGYGPDSRDLAPKVKHLNKIVRQPRDSPSRREILRRGPL